MTAPQQTFMTYSALMPFPAASTVQPLRSAWSLGFIVVSWVMGGATALGAAAGVLFGVVLFNPMIVVLGAVVGAMAGLLAGVVIGAVVALTVSLIRATRRGTVAG